jgi:glycosyltransferase involved in cell wall biosynthesis
VGKVIIWADEWFPVVGGLELALHRTAQWLASRDIEVVVITPADGHDRRNLGYFVNEIANRPWLREGFGALEEFIRPGDVVYISRLFHKYERAQLSLLQLLTENNTILRLPSTWGSSRYAGKEYRKLLNIGIDGFISLNRKTYNVIRKRFPTKDHSLIYNWCPPTGEIICDLEPVSFAYSGRLARSKNVVALIEAWSSLELTNASKLVLLTDPNQYPGRQSELLAMTPVGSVEVRQPYIPGKLTALSTYRFIILPSFREGCPNVLVEAFSMGIPVIGADIPGISEHLACVGAPIIPKPLSVEAIQGSINEALSMSEVEYRSLRERVRKYHAKNFSFEMVGPILLDSLMLRKT